MKKQHLILFVFSLLALAISFSGCKKEDEILYGINDVNLTPPNASKKKLKSDQQYVAVLHANLFQSAVSTSEMVEIGRVIRSIGDKGLAYEFIVSNFMNDGSVVLPSNADMRGDTETFLTETYERFFVRPPSEIEKEYFKNYIELNPNVTPELVYFAFAISDEYYFY